MLQTTGSMLRNWISDPAVQKNYGEPVYESYEDVKALLDNWIFQYKNKDFYRWAVILKDTGESIGQIAFCRVYTEAGTAEVEYCTGRNFWGNGYTAEALRMILQYSFGKPGFEKLEAFHRTGNPNSGRVLEKSGLRKAANITRFELICRQPVNEICYALTKYEYFRSSDKLKD